MHVSRIGLVGLIVLVALPPSLRAQANPAVLAGVQSIAPFVENRNELRSSRTDSARIQQVLELELRRAGIRVVAAPDRSGGFVVITVVATPVQNKAGVLVGFAYALTFEYGEIATLGHGAGERLVYTYEIPSVVGVGGPDSEPGDIFARATTEFAERFANDYLTANPNRR